MAAEFAQGHVGPSGLAQQRADAAEQALSGIVASAGEAGGCCG